MLTHFITQLKIEKKMAKEQHIVKNRLFKLFMLLKVRLCRFLFSSFLFWMPQKTKEFFTFIFLVTTAKSRAFFPFKIVNIYPNSLFLRSYFLKLVTFSLVYVLYIYERKPKGRHKPKNVPWLCCSHDIKQKYLTTFRQFNDWLSVSV
jgi:hypothetical protein